MDIEDLIEKNEKEISEAEKKLILEEQSKKIANNYKTLYGLTNEVNRLYRERCRLLGRLVSKYEDT